MHHGKDIGVYSISVLNFLSSSISVIFVLMCIAVSSSPVVCGFSLF